MVQPTSMRDAAQAAAHTTAPLSTTGVLATTAPTPAHPPMSDDMDIRVDQLHDALRLVITNIRRQQHHGEVDKAAFALLYVIGEREPVRAADLAQCTGLDASTISRHIKASIDAGLIDQTPDPDDARARLLSLSPTGHDLLHRVRASKVARSRSALADWSQVDIDTLTVLLRRLGAALEPEDS